MSLQGKKIILGITGSIAAYKSALLTRLLIRSGAEVQVVMTEEACNFITPLTLSTLSKRECLVDFTTYNGRDWHNHVELGLWADVLLMAPATANTVAKMAGGLCDSLLMGVYLSARCPVLIAPAMDEDMWRHPSTQKNLETLRSFGNRIMPVGEGELASGLIGPGRMAEPEDILDGLHRFFSNTDTSKKKGDVTPVWAGKKILITAGPTFEPIDPVRFVGNHSSGKMGIALAEAAAARGAEVVLILGPSHLQPDGKGITLQRVTTCREMMAACQPHFEDTDIGIFAAAVSDYAPVAAAAQKMKKSTEHWTLELSRNADIAAAFGNRKKNGQVSVGFALETESELEHAREKLKKKHFDLIVLNSLNDTGAGFRHDTNKVTLMDRYNNTQQYELKSKDEVAADILDKVESLL